MTKPSGTSSPNNLSPLFILNFCRMSAGIVICPLVETVIISTKTTLPTKYKVRKYYLPYKKVWLNHQRQSRTSGVTSTLRQDNPNPRENSLAPVLTCPALPFGAGVRGLGGRHSPPFLPSAEERHF
jgi:hypothetical protein